LRVWKHYDYEAETCTAVIECEDATWAALFQTELAGKSLQQILDIEVAHALELEELDTTEPTGDLVDGREKRRAVSLPDLAGRKLAVEAKLRRGFTKTDAAVAEWKRTRGTR
jgi:hypothetical protein